MRVQWVDHLNLRVPEDRVDEFVAVYRDAFGFECEHLDSYCAGDKPFFFVRLGPDTILHVSPTDEFVRPDGSNFYHVAVAVDESQEAIRSRVRDSAAEIVQETVRLGARGESPSIYVEDPFGYVVEFKPASDALEDTSSPSR